MLLLRFTQQTEVAIKHMFFTRKLLCWVVTTQNRNRHQGFSSSRSCRRPGLQELEVPHPRIAGQVPRETAAGQGHPASLAGCPVHGPAPRHPTPEACVEKPNRHPRKTRAAVPVQTAAWRWQQGPAWAGAHQRHRLESASAERPEQETTEQV